MNTEKKQGLEYYQAMVENLPGGIAVVRYDADGSMTPEFLTNGFADLTKMTKEEAWELYGKDALAGVHPDDIDEVVAKIREHLQENKSQSQLEYRLLNGEGEYFYVKNTMSIVKFDEETYYIYSVYTDLTEAREKEKELRKKYEDLIRKHYENPRDKTLALGHCNVSQNQVLDFCDYTNMDLTKVYGKERDTFFKGISLHISGSEARREFLGNFLSENALKAYKKGIRKISQECFLSLPNKDRGKYVNFNMDLVEEPGSGDITGILTMSDVTNQVMNEMVLNSASVLNSDFVLDLDIFKDEYRLLSKSKDTTCFPELEGCHTARMKYMMENAIIPADVEIYKDNLLPENVMKKLKEEGSYSFPFTIYDEKGVRRAKSIAVSPIDLRIGRVCLVRTDITDLLEAERKSKETIEKALEEAKKASKAKSEFLSRMSHDIRTPLNGVIGMTEIVLEENKDPKIQRELEIIASSGKFLLSLINDILDISRIESGKMELHPVPAPLYTFDNMIDAIIRPLMKEKNITFEYKMNCGLQCALLDPVRFNQIFFNLLSNAAKFTPEDGHVIFAAWALSEEEIPKGAAFDDSIEWVRFSVKDNGIGMSKEFLRRAFKPFEQLDDAYGKNQIQGSGLGLAIVSELVNLMGGRIQVKSKLHEGSEFFVDLPMVKCPLPKDTQRKNDDSFEALAGKKVLLVEDNKINRFVAQLLLEKKKMIVTCASNGKEAFDMFKTSKEGSFDIILMDIRMPVMDGIEATRAIRELPRYDAKAIPIIAMSANAYEEDRKLSMEAGLNAHLSKPVEPEAMFETFAMYLK